MKVIGLSADTWIASAALVEDGKIIAAVAEERLNRQKKYKGFPSKSIDFCLKKANCSIKDIDYIVVGWNPGRHIRRYNHRFSNMPRWRAEHLYAIPNSLMQFFDDKEIEFIEQELQFKDAKCKIVYIDHHLAHSANAFFLSSFEEAAIVTVDGKGENETATYAVGKGTTIKKLGSTDFPHSLGLFYGTFTEFLGFRPDSDEWKVMALASYIKDENPYYEKVRKLIKVLPNGKIEMDVSYFNYYLHDQLHMFTDKLVEEFGEPRKKDSELKQKHYQIAHALQKVSEEVLTDCLNYIQGVTNLNKVVVNGGSFMNSVFNGKIINNTKFDDVFISSCPDDSGISIGAALYVCNKKSKNCKRYPQVHNYYGPEFSNDEIKKTLDVYNIKYEFIEDVEKFAAEKIAEGKLIGWFQGKLEFGQRALGNRSIVCDARVASMKDKVNSAVKYREAFRPFAPSILEEYREEYFDIDDNTFVPFMEKVYMIKKEKQKIIPAVTHVDGSGRLQTVNKEVSPKYYKLISEFNKITGVPIVLNTSFNLNGEPIVCSPKDAIRTFYSCGLNILILGNYVITKIGNTMD
ncbi:carbamoyltransferase [Candidatus Woesearchaeota archaeon]|jgi:carbamoyltransferase|nr:carbamoyltransferase [Candidatus Woesearchaeota archaeon]MBT7402689.1 carbamoyltransferase [Candidatus Woesearchaeota archaeon]